MSFGSYICRIWCSVFSRPPPLWGFWGGQVFSTPLSDEWGLTALPINLAKNSSGWAGIQIFPGELHAFKANIYREKKSFFDEK